MRVTKSQTLRTTNPMSGNETTSKFIKEEEDGQITKINKIKSDKQVKTTLIN